ncbi:hypothetical protein AWC38_SpisGene7684 [Stylophora pistillata]|uniref:Reverse transcriptase zinc-binding domain-containing protein n=1 Tax=Stylophora pistillata TaxID=50429 RepID=A0A2B4SGA1_STYPI|nr:hypothetical protein AWC38_SpisGene7684 [Stylophora pistillata]
MLFEVLRKQIVFTASESKLSRVMKSVRAAMEYEGLIRNPKKCAVAHFKRGVRVAESTSLLMSDGNINIQMLEDGQQYKFLGERGLRSVETEYKETKVKAAVNLYLNRDPAMKMVREYVEEAESKGYQSMTKEAGKYAEEYGLQLQLNYPDPACVTEEGEVLFGDKWKTRLRKLQEARMERVVEEQKWQEKLITARKEDGDLNTEQCFWWLSKWPTCPTRAIAGMFEIYEQLLPTRLYAIHKTQASPTSDPSCRLCGTAPESLAHLLSACPALAQTKYLARHDAVLKVLFFDIIEYLGLIETSPPWYSPTKPQPVYEGAHAQSF